MYAIRGSSVAATKEALDAAFVEGVRRYVDELEEAKFSSALREQGVRDP
ncbi:MAG: hypothetical protein ACRC4O_03440 [Giesbergeria sp.]